MRGAPSSREAGRFFVCGDGRAWRARGRRHTSFHATKRAASDTTAPSGGQIRRSMHALLARSARTSRRCRRKRRRSPNFLPGALLCGSARSSAPARQSVQPATQSRPQAPKTVTRCTLCWQEVPAAPAPRRPRRPPNLAKRAPPAPPHASQCGNSTDDPAAR